MKHGLSVNATGCINLKIKVLNSRGIRLLQDSMEEFTGEFCEVRLLRLGQIIAGGGECELRQGGAGYEIK